MSNTEHQNIVVTVVDAILDLFRRKPKKNKAAEHNGSKHKETATPPGKSASPKGNKREKKYNAPEPVVAVKAVAAVNDVVVVKFDSPSAYLEWATNAPSPWKGDLESRKTKDSEWSGTRNYHEAYELARFGWKEGLKMLTEQVKLAELIAPPPQFTPKTYDIAGYYPVPARAAAGDIFSMVTKRPQDLQKQNPVIKIRVNCSYPAYTSVEKIMQWGAAVCSYINELERQKKSIELIYCDETFPSMGMQSRTNPAISFQFPLKKAGQPLSLSNVVFWWAHPSALRRIGFAATEKLDIEAGYSYGYGRPGKVTESEPGTLDLSINDAGSTIQESLANIYRKHQELIQRTQQPKTSPTATPRI